MLLSFALLSKPLAHPFNNRGDTTSPAEAMHANLRTQAVVVAEEIDAHAGTCRF